MIAGKIGGGMYKTKSILSTLAGIIALAVVLAATLPTKHLTARQEDNLWQAIERR